ncbi:MAG: EF-hand domain-containing protein [Hoeflea sp.]|nr:EF-hand domain-containing protein [Hoeflea sp.]
MKKTLLASLAAALIASIALPAMAAQSDRGPGHGPRAERMMERFDADRDGVVTLEDISAHRLSMFETIDTDKSGSLSKDELKAFGDMRKEMRETNREERRANREARMEEMKGMSGGRDGRMAGKHDGKHHGKRDGMGRGEGRGNDRGGMQLERMDADKNGEVSLEEFTALDAKMFERFDRNGDGKIDITDFYRERADNN